MQYIYIIKFYKWFKIGKSNNPKNRLLSIKPKTKLPYSFELYATVQDGDVDSLERQIHKEYSHLRLNGEWFEFDKKTLAYLVDKYFFEVCKLDKITSFENAEYFEKQSLLAEIERLNNVISTLNIRIEEVDFSREIMLKNDMREILRQDRINTKSDVFNDLIQFLEKRKSSLVGFGR